MADTMLRSGVPPHMGQSPVFGSEALIREALAQAAIKPTEIISARLLFISVQPSALCPDTY
jgi:hypothetical protein